MRFIATADWQLGMTAHFLKDESRPRFHQARLDAVRKIGEVASERGAEFVVICGDVFESNQLDRSIVTRTFEALRSFTVPLVFLPGNHDPLDSVSIYDSAMFQQRVPQHVHVLRDSTPFEVVPGVEIVGAPWRSKRPLTDLVAEACKDLEPAPANVIRVIAGHGAVSTLNPDRDSLATIDVPTLRQVLDDGRAHVAVIGDRHATYEVESGIWYPGAPEVTSRREDDPGNVLVIDVNRENNDDPAGGAKTERVEVKVEKIRVGNWVFSVIEERLDSIDDVELFAKRLQDIPDKAQTAVWLALSGTLTTAANARLESMLEESSDLFAHLDYWQRHTDLAVIPDGEDFADLGLSGFADEALAELTELANKDDDSALVAQDALGLLYRYSGGTK